MKSIKSVLSSLLPIMLLSFILIIGGFFDAVIAQNSTSQMGEVAASMGPNTWVEFSTIGVATAIYAGDNKNILEYTDGGAWDPNSEQFFFMGQGHNQARKFVTYSAATNTWEQISDPSWLSSYIHQVTHGYDHSAINQAGRAYYHRPFQWPTVYKYNIDSESWSELPSIPGFSEWNNCCAALEYFPELDGLVLVSAGDVLFFNESTSQWSTRATNLSMGPYHHFAEYNPIHQVMLFGGGNNDNANGGPNGRKIYKLDSQGNITSLNDAPTSMGILSSVTTLDPMTGTYIVLANGLVLYAYDIVADNWIVVDNNPPLPTLFNGNVFSVIATPISNYGVIMFVTSVSFSDSKVYLYKYSDLPTPVELVSFTLGTSNVGIILNWATASETNNYGFEIERKTAGADFEIIGFVRGKGTTSLTQDYMFVDKSVQSSVQYGYRLKQIDLNGTYEYSQELSIMVDSPNAFKLLGSYPNPFNPVTTIRFEIPSKSNLTLVVYDIFGRTVRTLLSNEVREAGRYSIPFEASELSSGVYFYQVSAGDTWSQVGKMLLIK